MSHGNSRFIFYHADKKFKAQYHFDMPDELPVKLNTNTLYFIDKDQKPAKTLTISINDQLPSRFSTLIKSPLQSKKTYG